jgi:O6-methylguanine-DNA--protein-cysteine methyltransferase
MISLHEIFSDTAPTTINYPMKKEKTETSIHIHGKKKKKMNIVSEISTAFFDKLKDKYKQDYIYNNHASEKSNVTPAQKTDFAQNRANALENITRTAKLRNEELANRTNRINKPFFFAQNKPVK